MKISVVLQLLVATAAARSIGKREPLNSRSKSVSCYSKSSSSSSSSSYSSYSSSSNGGSSNSGSSDNGPASSGSSSGSSPSGGTSNGVTSSSGGSNDGSAPAAVSPQGGNSQDGSSTSTPGSPGTSSGSDTSGGKPIIDSINAFRQAANLPLQTWDVQLAGNAAKTGQATNGKSQKHWLILPTMGQTLSAGAGDHDKCSNGIDQYTPFELAYYSWLCEVPGDPALNGRCDQLLDLSNINVKGTGHYDILTSTKYTRIGCAFTRDPDAKQCGQFTGVWACDLSS